MLQEVIVPLFSNAQPALNTALLVHQILPDAHVKGVLAAHVNDMPSLGAGVLMAGQQSRVDGGIVASVR